MKAELAWLDNPVVFRVNQLEAHSDHPFYQSKEDMVLSASEVPFSQTFTEKNSLLQSLNGIWKFRYSVSATERPDHFYQEDFIADDFDEIAVPCFEGVEQALPRRTVLSILGAVRGVGGINSWGADVESDYHIDAGEDIRYSFQISKV